ncbi:ABC transporter substrate-binding protein, partial [Gordonia sp. (in: high G+C Gram-positive bacteria)]
MPRLNSRRHVRTAAVAAALAGVMALSACGDKSTDTASSGSGLEITPLAQIDTQGNEQQAVAENQALDPAGDGKAQCPETTLAQMGALTGADAALGINMRDGAQLAVAQHNAANPNCKIVLKTFDTEGDPQKATQVAPQIVNDKSIVGLIGPGFSGETKATGGVFNQAGLVAVTASA